MKTIYRCGWCGWPVDENGDQLPTVIGPRTAQAYLEYYNDVPVEQVDGFCCPDGGMERGNDAVF